MDKNTAYFFSCLTLVFLTGLIGKVQKNVFLLQQKFNNFTRFLGGTEETHSVFKRVCYYLLHPKDGSKLPPEQIDPYLCSHIVIGYAEVGKSGLLLPKRVNDDPDKFRQIANLKLKNKDLKVLLSVGDKNSGSSFSTMASSNGGRETFADSAVDITEAYDLDGIDIDWEFPAWKGLPTIDRRNFILLIEDLKAAARKRHHKGFLVTATVGTPLAIATAAYDIPELAKPYTGHHSPLYARPTEKGYFATLNTAWAATFWANKGMPFDKIVVGVPTFARTYSLAVPHGQGLDAPVSGPGLGGGKLNYTRVCEFIGGGATKEYDIYGQVPFAYKDFDWVAFENEKSVSVKARWVAKAGFGGIMSYALNFDDWTGSCREDKKTFPLQRSISRTLELASIRSYQKWAKGGDVIIPAGSKIVQKMADGVFSIEHE